MKESLKHAGITLAVCVLLILGIVIGFKFCGKNVKTQIENETQSNPQSQAESEETKINKPDKIAGVYFSKKDMPDNLELSKEEIQKNTQNIASDLSKNGFNTAFLDIFMDDEISNEYINSLIESLKGENIYICAVIDSINSNDSIVSILKEKNIPCAVFKGEEKEIINEKNLADKMRKSIPQITLASFANAESAEKISENLLLKNEDFLIYVPLSYEDSVKNYISQAEKFSSAAGSSVLSAVAGIRLDLLKDNFKTQSEAAAVISEQMELISSFDSFCGTAIFNYTELFDGSSVSKAVLSYTLNQKSDIENKQFEIKNFNSTIKYTDESKFTFTGTSSPLYSLTMNEKEVERENNGDFSFEVKLKKGDNTFKFSHKKKTYTYKVVYNAEIIKSVTPASNITVPGSSTVTIKAVILKGSTAYATLGGDKISLKRISDVVPGESGSLLDESSDFAVYSGKYKVPSGKSYGQALGRIKVYASFNGISASLAGAKVTVSPEIQKPVPKPGQGEGETIKPDEGESQIPFDPSKMLTPYKYAGVEGKSKMCEITTLCETMPADVLDDCVPYSSPLPKGTFDYVLSEYTFDNKQYLKLASGKNILAEKAKIINSGYNLPKNRIEVLKSESNSNSTDIKFGLSWKAPFNVSVKNQSYIPQSQASGGSLHSITSFNAKYIDITFYHALNVSGKVDLVGSKIVSSAQWTSNSKDSTINLRLTLKSPGKFYGYSMKYTKDGALTLSIKAKPSYALSGSVIMLDPGHGGKDSGAICAYNPDSSKKYEKQLNLLIANKVKAKLEAQGATVIMTRNSDVYLSLDERQNMVRQKNPDLFISLHCDSSTSAGPMGTTAFYYQAYSYNLAKSVHSRIVSSYKNSIYAGASSSVLNKIDRGANVYPFRVIRVEECPAILVEYGFISNINECKLLWMNSTQEKLAQATVDGIRDYIVNS